MGRWEEGEVGRWEGVGRAVTGCLITFVSLNPGSYHQTSQLCSTTDFTVVVLFHQKDFLGRCHVPPTTTLAPTGNPSPTDVPGDPNASSGGGGGAAAPAAAAVGAIVLVLLVLALVWRRRKNASRSAPSPMVAMMGGKGGKEGESLGMFDNPLFIGGGATGGARIVPSYFHGCISQGLAVDRLRQSGLGDGAFLLTMDYKTATSCDLVGLFRGRVWRAKLIRSGAAGWTVDGGASSTPVAGSIDELITLLMDSTGSLIGPLRSPVVTEPGDSVALWARRGRGAGGGHGLIGFVPVLCASSRVPRGISLFRLSSPATASTPAAMAIVTDDSSLDNAIAFAIVAELERGVHAVGCMYPSLQRHAADNGSPDAPPDYEVSTAAGTYYDVLYDLPSFLSSFSLFFFFIS